MATASAGAAGAMEASDGRDTPPVVADAKVEEDTAVGAVAAEADEDEVPTVRPVFGVADAAKILAEGWGLEEDSLVITELPSYDDRNFKVVRSVEGKPVRKFVLKVNSVPTEADDGAIDLENEMFLRLEQTPNLVTTVGGKDRLIIGTGRGGKARCSARVITFVEGPLLAQVPLSDELLTNLGLRMAEMDKVLIDFEHPGAHRPGFIWDMRNCLDIQPHCHHVPDESDRRLCERAFELYARDAQPLFSKCRSGVLHNDVNDYNVIATPDGSDIAAFIDFGDVMRTKLVFELAIALGYIMMAMDKVQPKDAAVLMIKGYVQVLPLLECEAQVLFTLARARVASSVVMGSRTAAVDPANVEYTSTHAVPGRKLLHWLAGERDAGAAAAAGAGADPDDPHGMSRAFMAAAGFPLADHK